MKLVQLLSLAACAQLVCDSAFAGETSEPVKLANVPSAVKTCIHTIFGKGKLLHLTKVTSEDEIVYEGTFAKNNRRREFTVSDDANLIETQIFINELPAAVAQAVSRLTNHATLGEMTKVVDDGDTTFDIDVTTGNATRTFTYNESGQFISQEVLLDETP